MTISHKNCDEAIASLYQFLDRELTWFSRFRIRRHLKRCGFCPRAYAFEERLQMVVRARLGEEVPPELIDRLRRALAEGGSASE
jgi:mycothiol system anti-sigma-R factor